MKRVPQAPQILQVIEALIRLAKVYLQDLCKLGQVNRELDIFQGLQEPSPL